MKRRAAEMWIMITADRRRATILCVLMIILTGVGAQTLLSRGPKRARAAADAVTPEGASKLKSEKGSPSRGRGGGSRTERESTASAPEPAAIVRLVRSPRVARDLFKLNDERFPPPQTEPTSDSKGLAEKSAAGSDEKTSAGSAPSEDDVRQRVAQEASRLRLRSILLGSRPAAVIETTGAGRKERRTVLSVGQTVEGFTIAAVAQDGVTIEKEGVQVVLRRELPEPTRQ